MLDLTLARRDKQVGLGTDKSGKTKIRGCEGLRRRQVVGRAPHTASISTVSCQQVPSSKSITPQPCVITSHEPSLTKPVYRRLRPPTVEGPSEIILNSHIIHNDHMTTATAAGPTTSLFTVKETSEKKPS